ncbi:MAG TPA: TetR/AcrR family transcriptional regulator [Steroidobacteraceae bacterium]|nr:TetR/AcrR family transcriptional regulator [Steroidobacteraceae bacterium]
MPPTEAATPQTEHSGPSRAARTQRRKRGRPSKISPELILATSLQVLAHTPVEDFMIKTVAGKLGTTSMAIYRYFPSRAALLLAVTDEVCDRFEAPAEGATWQDTVTRWLWAIKRHADRNPMMLYVFGINGRVSRGWARLTIPLTVLMYEKLGMRGKALSLATYLFGATVSSMLHVIAHTRARHASHILPRIAEVTSDEHEARVLQQTRLDSLSEKEALDALFAQYIAGIELLLKKRSRPTAR